MFQNILLQKHAPKHLSLTRYYIKPNSILRDIGKSSRWQKLGFPNCLPHTFYVQSDHSSYFKSVYRNYLKSHGSNLPKLRKTNPLIQIKEGNVLSSVLELSQPAFCHLLHFGLRNTTALGLAKQF